MAEAIGKEDWTTAKERVCESLYLSNVLGGLFSLILIGWPKLVLRLVLPSSLTEAASVSGAMSVLDYAVPYLRWRAIGECCSLCCMCFYVFLSSLVCTDYFHMHICSHLMLISKE